MTKPSDTPSKWTPQEAWEKFRDLAHQYVVSLLRDRRVQGPNVTQAIMELDGSIRNLAFPADPVERVSDDELAGWTEDGMMRPVRLMALELIERRKAEKEGKG